jgi:hypothetical protein
VKSALKIHHHRAEQETLLPNLIQGPRSMINININLHVIVPSVDYLIYSG